MSATAKITAGSRRLGVTPLTPTAAIKVSTGQSWDIITDMAIKLVPGGHSHHALAEAPRCSG
jgi:hypothetical protein